MDSQSVPPLHLDGAEGGQKKSANSKNLCKVLKM